jgi:hypothetical protein
VHVLTKIFIVLVSLLAVLLVPLMVVYATNENNYRARYESAEAAKAAEQAATRAALARSSADAIQYNTQLDALRNQNQELQTARTAADVTIRQLESQLAAARAAQATIVGDISMIKNIVEAGQQLTESLVGEIRTLRAEAVAIERQKVELDEALRDVTGQLEVAEQARRALAEELARLKDEHSKALTQLGMAIGEGFGRKDVVRTGVLPDRNLTATIVRVERSAGQVLAEIDAGSRDGVREGWTMAISSGGAFVGNLRIINVDINRATGIVSLEDRARGLVAVGQTAHALAGQN